jgi:hypothetical protein
MKKIFLLFSLFYCVAFNSSAQISGACYYDGYWGEWTDYGNEVKIRGNYDGFIIYSSKEGPWEYRFKFTINNLKFPNKKQRKKDIAADKWYVFTGTVEYYITDDNPSILSLFRKAKRPLFSPAKLDGGRPTKKITSKAKIRIAPFRNVPEYYNIWFDNVGFGIHMKNVYFPGKIDSFIYEYEK